MFWQCYSTFPELIAWKERVWSTFSRFPTTHQISKMNGRQVLEFTLPPKYCNSSASQNMWLIMKCPSWFQITCTFLICGKIHKIIKHHKVVKWHISLIDREMLTVFFLKNLTKNRFQLLEPTEDFSRCCLFWTKSL